jgi:type IV pilus assembly protein PilW
MKKFTITASQKGMTLVELLIAMLVGVLLTTGVLKIFINAKSNYKLQENLSRLQDNGRMALNLMSNDIRMAGYISSAAILNGTLAGGTTNTCLPAPQAFDLANNTPTATAWCSSTNQNCASSSATNTNNNIRRDVIRSYQWTTAAACPLTAPTGTATVNGVGVLAGAKEISYFLRSNVDNGDMATGASVAGLSVVPSLWKYDSSQAGARQTQEYIQNVEQMVVMYGIDTDTVPDYIPNYYVTADNMTLPGGASAWSNVVSVRVSLLVVSDDNGLVANNLGAGGLAAAQPYIFPPTVNGVAPAATTPPNVCSYNGVIVSNTTPCTAPAVSTPDLRIRRVFSTTIAVRNRLN